MKKKLIIAIVVILLIALPVGLYFLLKLNSGKLAEGKYRIVGSEKYPDAYIEVKGSEFRVYNIDLNEYWRQTMYDKIVGLQNNPNVEFDSGYSEEELWNISDLNEVYVNKAYQYDPDQKEKIGTYTFEYACLYAGNLFGLYIDYDSWNQTIELCRFDTTLRFEQ